MTQTRKTLKAFVFARPEDPLCPVTTFKKYASKCPSGGKSFYLHLTYAMTSAVSYSRRVSPTTGTCWKRSAKWVSTNYSLWSTSVGWLSNTSLEPHQIMMPTDHWCEGSLHVTAGETRMEPDKQWLLWPVLSCQTSSFKHHFLNLPTSLSKFTIKGNVEFNFWIVWCKIPINSVVFLLT